jgi:hypothetical protein
MHSQHSEDLLLELHSGYFASVGLPALLWCLPQVIKQLQKLAAK